MILLFVEYIYM